MGRNYFLILFYSAFLLGVVNPSSVLAEKPLSYLDQCRRAQSKLSEVVNYNWEEKAYEFAFRTELSRATKSVRTKYIPLSDLEPGHPITIPATIEKVNERANAIRAKKDKIPSDGKISISLLDKMVSSGAPVRVFQLPNGKYKVFDGNGRTAAIRQALGENAEVFIEVEEHVLSQNKTVLEKLKAMEIARGEAPRPPLFGPPAPKLRQVEEFKDYQTLLASSFEGYEEAAIWWGSPIKTPAIESLVEKVLSLSPQERATALSILEKNASVSPGLRKILELALFDKAAWEEQLSRGMTESDEKFAFMNSLIPLLRKMPDELRDHLLAKLAPGYLSLSKERTTLEKWQKSFRSIGANLGLNRRPGYSIAPKRSMDAFIQHVLRPDQTIASQVQAGKEPKLAYQEYVDDVRTRLFGSENSDRLRLDDILQVGRSIQEVLKSNSDGSSEPFILIAGSVPNGRATFTSDMDVKLSDKNLEKLFPQIDKAVNAGLRSKFPGAAMEMHSMLDDTTPNLAAMVNPAFLKITPKGIEVVVYEGERPLDRDKAMQPYNYKAPKTYLLEGEPSVATPPSSSKEKAREVSAADVVRQTLSSKYEGLSAETEWLKAPQSDSKIQEVVEACVALSPSDRKVFVKEFVKSPPTSPVLKKILGLALYDYETWGKYFDEISQFPTNDDTIMNALVPVLQNMPEPMVKHFHKKIHDLYPTVSKFRTAVSLTQGIKRGELAPKRSMDIFLAQTIPAQKIIDEKIAEGKTAIDAYSEYLTTLREKAFYGHEHGNYSASEVLDVAREMQKELVRKGSETGVKDPSIMIVGSLTNGRAKLSSSDIDVIPSDFRLEKLYPAIDIRVNTHLKGKNLKAGLETHTMGAEFSPVNAAAKNPVFVRVSEEKIELVVYDRIKPLPGDTQFLPKNYEEPKVYLLEERSR